MSGRAGLAASSALARGTVAQRLRAVLIGAASWLACRLPESVVTGLAELAGEIWYRVTPMRAAQARRNLARVVGHLAATGSADPSVRAAAAQPAELERLVRSAYRHAARYYLDMIRVPAIGPGILRERLDVETPEVVGRAFGSDRPVVFVGLHFGSIELPALFLAVWTGRTTTVPMETLTDPALQGWFVRTRSSVGLRIVGLLEARRELLGALERGESVGLIADRDLSGGGIPVTLFGTPARLPVGPALLAIETGAPVYVAAVRRVPGGRWRGQLREVAVPTEGSRRARLTATLEGLARAFEEAVAVAPEQWWTIFFPIWDDLADPRARPTIRRGPTDALPPGEAASAGPGRAAPTGALDSTASDLS